MDVHRINYASRMAIGVLAMIALLTVISGYFQPPQQDEGTAAHIFQLSIVAFMPTLLVFLVTTDWKEPLRIARRLLFPGAVLVIAFGALYYLEHFRWQTVAETSTRTQRAGLSAPPQGCAHSNR